MVLALQYGDLSGAVFETNRLAEELGQYCDELSRKVQQKMYAVEGGMSSALQSADYYVNQKIRQLRARESDARALSSKTQNLLETAKRVDADVAKTIQSNQKAFFQKNPEMKAPWYQQAFVSFLCDMKKVPVIGWLIDGGEKIAGAMDVLGKEIRHWWRCGGGKELITNCVDLVWKISEAVGAVVAAVIAVAALVTATVLTAGAVIIAVASCVAAVIAVVNAVTNTATSLQAIRAGSNGDPAMAKIYGECDTYAQWLRQHNFHDKKKNRESYIKASVVEIADAVSGIILLVQSVGKIVGNFLTKQEVGFAFKELARGSDGKLVKKVTLHSIWKGTKAMVLNQKLTTSTSAGLRTTLKINIKQAIVSMKQAVKYQSTLVKMAARDPGGWLKKKQTGDRGLFKNIAEKFRYNAWMLKNSAFQFRKNDVKYNLDKVSKVTSATSDVIKNIKFTLDVAQHAKNKGFFRRKAEKYVKETLFDNDFVKLLSKTGIGEALVGFDKSNLVKDFTGIGGKGILQKADSIVKSVHNAGVPFREKFPYYECAGEV